MTAPDGSLIPTPTDGSRTRLIIGLVEGRPPGQVQEIRDALERHFPDLDVTVITGCTALAVIPATAEVAS